MEIFSCFSAATRNHRTKMDYSDSEDSDSTDHFDSSDNADSEDSDSPDHYDSLDNADSESEYAEDSSPETSIMKGSSIRDMDRKSYSDQRQISSKVKYTGYGGSCSGKVTKTSKSGAMVDGRNGNHVYKDEVDYDYSLKVTDKKLGITTQYETQVKHKKTTSYANRSSRSGGGKSSTKTGYTFAKPSKSSGRVQFKNAGGTSAKYTSKGSGSGAGKCKIVAKYSSSSKSSGRRK